MAAVPDPALAAVRRHCEAKTPAELSHEMRLDVEVRGDAITVFDSRPPWHPDMGTEWTQVKVAQFRFDETRKMWSLYWSDRNGRWHPYDDVDPSPDIGDLLDELDADPTGIFFG
jgi:hypothetical protein